MSRTLPTLALLFLVGSAHAAPPDLWSRFFYDQTCQTRWSAEFVYLQDGALVVRCSDGRLHSLNLQQAARSERFFAAAVHHAKKASTHFAQGAWRAEREWIALSRELQAHGVRREEVLVPFLSQPPRLPDLVDLTDRWIVIGGVQYHVRGAAQDGPATGFTEIIVDEDGGEQIVVDPAAVADVRILPAFWSKRTYRPPHPERDERSFIFQRRGPRATLDKVYGPANEWKYALQFDDVAGVWTDRELAQGHLWMARTSEQFGEWRADHVLSTAVWHYHQGNRLAEAANENGWTAEFPWYGEQWLSKQQLSQALTHYSEAARLAPGWAEPLARRAALYGALRQLPRAMDELDSFFSKPAAALDLPIEVRSHAQLIEDAHVVRARLLVHLARPWNYDDARVEANVDAAIQAVLSSANRLSEHRPAAARLLADLHRAAAEHFTVRQEAFVRDDKLGQSLLAAATAAKYTTPDPLRKANSTVPSNIAQLSILGDIKKDIADSTRYRENWNYWTSVVFAVSAAESVGNIAQQLNDDALRQQAQQELEAAVADYLGFTLSLGL